MKINPIDIFIVGSVAYFAVTGYFQGFIRVTLDILTLVAAFFIALDTHKYLAGFIERFGIPEDFSVVVSFFFVWAVAEIILFLIIQIFYPRIPEEARKSKLNKILGLIPALIKGVFITAIVVLVIISLPFSNKLQTMADQSYLGKPVADRVGFLESYVQNIFKDVIKPTQFTIIRPGSDETIELGYTVKNGTIDEESEQRMLELLNKERSERGLGLLALDKEIQKVARSYSKDMFEKGYFSHTSREGTSPFDRLEAAGIKYLSAGENLALAPDVYIAHKGLMESPGHKANILTPEFKKVGLGVVDGGKYGKMFTQNFTD